MTSYILNTLHKPDIAKARDSADIIRTAGGRSVLERLRNLEADLVKDRGQLRDYYIDGRRLRIVPLKGWDEEYKSYHDDNTCWYEAFALEIGGIDRRLIFTPHSWSQFLKRAKLPSGYAKTLFQENRKLLSECFNHALDMMESDYLIRLRGDSVRAILPSNYNRLDNLYVVRALISLIEDDPSFDKDYTSFVQELYCNGDDFELTLVNPKPKMLLQEVGDRAISGICIRNSDIGRQSSLVIENRFVRLVCLNGMVSSDSMQAKVTKQLQSILTTRYRDELPPDPLSDELQYKVNSVIREAWRECVNNMSHGFGALQTSLAALREIHLDDFDLNNEALVRAMISEVLHMSGMRVLRGMSTDEIYIALREEMHDFPNTGSVPLLLYNAITRYASRQGVLDEREQNNYPGHRIRPGRPRVLLTESDRRELADRVTRRTTKLLETGFNWRRAHTRAVHNIRKFTAPPIY